MACKRAGGQWRKIALAHMIARPSANSWQGDFCSNNNNYKQSAHTWKMSSPCRFQKTINRFISESIEQAMNESRSYLEDVLAVPILQAQLAVGS